MGRYGHACAKIEHFMIIYGGKDVKGGLLNDVVILDMNAMNWIRPDIGGVIPGAR